MEDPVQITILGESDTKMHSAVTVALVSSDAEEEVAASTIDSTVSPEGSVLNEDTQASQSPREADHQDLDQIWLWNSVVPQKITTSAHDHFSNHAKNSPDRPAICSWDGKLTYGELLQYSDWLAQRLLQLGVQEGSIVPLCFEKCVWTAVAILAVMRTGACFTLMDPSQPLARLQTIVEQVDAQVILTSELQKELGGMLGNNATVLSVGKVMFEDQPLSNSSSTSFPTVNCDAPMYVQFTSGSTGKPKGVVISFASYSSGAVPRALKVGYHSGSRCLDFPSYAFDVSIDCILCTLSTGGCVCVPSDDDRLNNLAGAIETLGANMVHVTPSVARLLSPEILSSIEVLGLGGEYVSPADVETWSSTCKIAIAYGPSECTVGCTINDEVSAACTGIGKGVGGITWIVDPDNHDILLPPGDIGELLIEGPIVGDGYLGQPEKTAELFIEDPVWLVAGHESYPGRSGRLYKTGDLVRYDVTSGHIIFVGRKDQQVKLRGQRVELGEVEHAMKACLPSSMTAVTDVLKFGGKGEASLVAFLAKHDGSRSTNATDLQPLPLNQETQAMIQTAEQQMSETLPRFMIPSNWILLSSIPMLVSGKIDRKRLREIGAGLSIRQIQQLKSKSMATLSPQSLESETKLLSAWRKVIGGGIDLSRDDNFFHIGGDSLRAMHLVAAARAVGLSLSVADIFKHPVLSDMARVSKVSTTSSDSNIPTFSLVSGHDIDVIKETAAEQCKIPIDAVEDIYPCTPLQEGIMALSAKFSDAYVAQRVVELPDEASAIALHKAFEAAAQDACILRTRIVQVPRVGLLQVVVRSQYEIRLRKHSNLEIYLQADQGEEMGLGTSLARFAIVDNHKTGGTRYVLTMHHALYDGWCIPLIVERVNRAFDRQPLAKATPFKAFIKFLREMDTKASAAYWTEHLQGSLRPQFPQLPYKTYTTRADSLLERYIPLKGPPKDHTMATLIRAAWALVAAHHVGSDEVVFGETLTGRNAAFVGAEQIEGPMITTVPLRVRINAATSTLRFLQQVHELAIERIPYEHVGLQNIRRLSPDAREACELRTGLVLHPKIDDGVRPAASGPADAFVPANEAEAAREALNFNTYALMLVITVDQGGFLVMASFDSNCVDAETMKAVLEQFEAAVQRLSNPDDYDLQSVRDSVFPGTRSELILNGVITPPLSTSGSPIDDKCHDQLTKIIPIRQNHAVAETLTEKELILRQVWSRVLGVEESELNKDSDFFDFGDSISAMKVVSEARSDQIRLTVAQLFKNRELAEVAEAAEWIKNDDKKLEAVHVEYQRFSALDPDMTAALVSAGVMSHLADPSWEVEDVYPARPLQSIAVDGTVKLPRFSVRYEVIYFNHHLDLNRLQNAIDNLIHNNEILRTVFIKPRERTFGVVLKKLHVTCKVYDVEVDRLSEYVRSFCALDVLRRHPLGSAFVDFFYMQNSDQRSALIFKISHAQYDEICLPNMLHELSALYEGTSTVLSRTRFSAFVKHVSVDSFSQSTAYWTNLLLGSSMTTIKPEIPLTSRKAISIFRTFNISTRPRSITVATLPTAAWAICLASSLSLRDLVFGEVVSGRNVGLNSADAINGPCWQYIPIRVQFQKCVTGLDLLRLIQNQHIASSRFEGLGLDEIRKNCTDWPNSTDWFGSVVHQDVEHVTELPFGAASSGMETIYPHLEVLREVKCQCFLKGDELTIEIVLYESWRDFGRSMMDNFARAMVALVDSPHTVIDL